MAIFASARATDWTSKESRTEQYQTHPRELSRIESPLSVVALLEMKPTEIAIGKYQGGGGGALQGMRKYDPGQLRSELISLQPGNAAQNCKQQSTQEELLYKTSGLEPTGTQIVVPEYQKPKKVPYFQIIRKIA